MGEMNRAAMQAIAERSAVYIGIPALFWTAIAFAIAWFAS